MLTQVLTTTLDERGHGWNHRVRNKNTTRSGGHCRQAVGDCNSFAMRRSYTPFSRKEGDEH